MGAGPGRLRQAQASLAAQRAARGLPPAGQEDATYAERAAAAGGTLALFMRQVDMLELEAAMPGLAALELDECSVPMDLLSRLVGGGGGGGPRRLAELRLRHTGRLAEVAGVLANAPGIAALAVDGDDGSELPDERGAAALAAVLPHCAALRSLRLSSVDLEADAVAALARTLALDACASLEELRLTDVRIGDAGARLLLAALSTNTRLVALGLDANALTDAALEGLPRALSRNRTLETLSLQHNEIGAFPPPPASCALREIALRHNPALVEPPPAVADADETGDAVARYFRRRRARQARANLLPLLLGTRARAGAASPVRRSASEDPLYDPRVWLEIVDYLPLAGGGAAVAHGARCAATAAVLAGDEYGGREAAFKTVGRQSGGRGALGSLLRCTCGDSDGGGDDGNGPEQ